MLGVTGNVLGDIDVIHVDEEYIIQAGSYVASTGTITLDTKWQGFRFSDKLWSKAIAYPLHITPENNGV